MDDRRGDTSGDRTTQSILDAALEQLEAFGVRRMTMEDVARRAGVSRVTVYRRFGSKDELIEAVVVDEARRFFLELETVVQNLDTAADRLAEGFAFSLDYLRNHSLLNRLLKVEPESVLPYVTTQGGPLLVTARRFLAIQLTMQVLEGKLPPIDVDTTAELLVRLVLSFFLLPESAIPLGTGEDARRFAHRYLIPALDGVPRRV